MTTPTVTLNPVTLQNVGVVTGLQICPAGFDTFNVYNGDITGVLLVSKSTSPQLTNSIPVQPLTNATITGNGPWYCSALSGTIAQVSAGTGELSPSPAQIAAQINALGLATETTQQTIKNIQNNSLNTLQSGIALPIGAAVETGGNLASAASQLTLGIAGNPLAKTTDVVTTLPNNIAATGVPLLTLPSTLVANVAVNLTGAAVNYGPFNVSQIAYEAAISFSSVTAATPFLEYALAWFDAGGVNIATDRGFIMGGTVPTHTVHLKGPTKGDQVQLTLVGTGMTISHALFQTSRVHARNEWKSVQFGASSGTPIPCDPVSGVLGAWATGSIASGATVSAVLPLFVGKVRGSVATFSGSDILTITINDNGNVGLVTAAIFEAEIQAGTDSSFEMNLPYDTCNIQVKNTGATAVSPTISLVAEEYLSNWPSISPNRKVAVDIPLRSKQCH